MFFSSFKVYHGVLRARTFRTVIYVTMGTEYSHKDATFLFYAVPASSAGEIFSVNFFRCALFLALVQVVEKQRGGKVFQK